MCMLNVKCVLHLSNIWNDKNIRDSKYSGNVAKFWANILQANISTIVLKMYLLCNSLRALYRLLDSPSVFPSLCLGFLAFVFYGWWGAGPSTQTPTRRTSVSLFVWVLSFDLSGKGGLLVATLPPVYLSGSLHQASFLARQKISSSRWRYFKEASGKIGSNGV